MNHSTHYNGREIKADMAIAPVLSSGGAEGHLLWGFSKASRAGDTGCGEGTPRAARSGQYLGRHRTPPVRSRPERQVLIRGHCFGKCVFQNMSHRIFHRNHTKAGSVVA